MLRGDTEKVRRVPTWLLPLAVFVMALAIYVPTATSDGRGINTDAAANSLTAWRIATTGAPWMEGLDLTEPGKVIHYGRGADGHMVTTRTPGQIWAAVPFYLGSGDSQEDDFGYGPAGVAAATMSAAAVMLMFLALRRHTSVFAALGGTAVFAFATPVWSVSANTLWTHPVTVLGLAGAAWAASRNRWWSVGVWLGLAIFGRAHVAIIAAVVGLGMAWVRRSPSIAVRVGVPSLGAVGVLLLWNHAVFGIWDIRSGYGSDINSVIPGARSGVSGYLVNLAGYLVSPDRGFFVWTPLALLLLPALWRSWRNIPLWTRWFAVAGVAFAAVQLGVNGFGGGDAFHGYRLALELLVCVTPAYMCALPWAGRIARFLAPLVVGVQFAAVAFGALVDRYFVVDGDVWRDNSVWLALRTDPLAVGVLLAVGTLIGTLAAVLVMRAATRARARKERALAPRASAAV